MGSTPNPNSPEGIIEAIQSIYNNGITEGRSFITQSVSASYTPAKVQYYSLSYTFTKMTRLIGIYSISNNGPANCAPNSLSISSNRATLQVYVPNANANTTRTVTLAGYGY